MRGHYIIKKKSGVMSIFFENECIRCKKWGNEEREIICGVSPYFTENIDDKGRLMMFCQNMQGDIILCTENNGQWKAVTILENSRSERQKMLFYCIAGAGNMSLIYNVPTDNIIMRQNLGKNGVWEAPEKLDDIYDGDNEIFKVQIIKGDHLLLFYRKKSPELQAGYKEITKNKSGSFNMIYSTGYNISDSSYITDGENIHFLYIVKSMFFNQVIYRRKDGKGLSASLVLFEGQGVKDCIVQIIVGKLYCCFICSGRILYRVSNDNGNSFEKTARYEKPVSSAVSKAEFICDEKNDKFICSEVYTNGKGSSEVYFINEYLYVSAEEQTEKNIEDNDEYRKMKNALLMYKKEIEKKENTISDMNEMLKIKNAEIARLEREYRKLKNGE
ncbi:MAG: hypothetical protein IJ736_00590 [Firmicutes bacterium]|nr:hypothetical protein [Bacillota bacterium]